MNIPFTPYTGTGKTVEIEHTSLAKCSGVILTKPYNIPRKTWVKIEGMDDPIFFEHIDGMYYYCKYKDNFYIVYLHTEINFYTEALAALLNGNVITNSENTWAAKCQGVITGEQAYKEHSLSEMPRDW